jgi:hypothetical protein
MPAENTEELILEALKERDYFDISSNAKKTEIRNELAQQFAVDAVWIKDVVVNNYGKAGRKLPIERIIELLGLPGAAVEIQKISEDPAEGIATASASKRRIHYASAAPKEVGNGILKILGARAADPGLEGLVIINNGNDGPLASEEFEKLRTVLSTVGLYACAVHSNGVSHAVPAEIWNSAVPEHAAVTEDFAEVCEALVTDLKASGISNPPYALFARMIAALAAKRLLILTGPSGSGKTQLAHALARWISPVGPPGEGSSVRIVPVGADWTSNEKMLGYPDALSTEAYISTPVLDLVLHAIDNPTVAHFLILDEMNLSHVERYFADFLSAIESREPIPLHSDSTRRHGSVDIPQYLPLPDNLFVIGTVNVDETTYMFSPKVLDRANVIEFRIDRVAMEQFLVSPTRPTLASLFGKGTRFAEDFLTISTTPTILSASQRVAYSAEMQLLFQLLSSHGAEFGYRVGYEASRFLNVYEAITSKTAKSTSGLAMDFVIAQKILPKLHGSRAKLGPVLKALWFVCLTEPTSRGSDPEKSADALARSNARDSEPDILRAADAYYPVSADKIARMWRLLAENGFSSFSE